MFARTTCLPSLLLLILVLPVSSEAQVGPLIEGPGRTRPEIPDFQRDNRTRSSILPPIVMPTSDTVEGLFTGVTVQVEDIHIVGNTILTSDELDKLISPCRRKRLSFADLENLRDQITSAYIDRGYVSSGAIIPDQTVQGGIVHIMAVEGKLAAIDASTDGKLNRKYVRDRLLIDPNRIVNVNAIEEKLQVLRQNPRIGKLQAELTPSEVRGESLLRVHVSEARAEDVLARFDNYQASTLGSIRASADFVHYDVTGRGDTLSGAVRVTQGLRAAAITYGIPLDARDTTLTFSADVSRSKIVEKPFFPVWIFTAG